MSHITLANAGLAAVEARDWETALTKLSAALQESTNPAWLVARSRALVGLGRFQEALDDANQAWHSAWQRNARSPLIDANYRRAVAYFRLGQYANADACCVYSMRIIKGFPALEKEDPAKKRTDANGFYTVTAKEVQHEAESDEINRTNSREPATVTEIHPNATEWRRASTLRSQSMVAMAKLPENDPARKLTVAPTPEKKALADYTEEEKKKKKSDAPGLGKVAPQATPKPVVPAETPLRVQDFQNDQTMSVSIFSKGVNKEKLVVNYTPFSVQMNAVIYPDGSERPFSLSLWGEIDPTASKHTVTPNKVELSLRKKTVGKWRSLQDEGPKEPGATEEAEKLSILKEARKKAMQVSEGFAQVAEPKAEAEDEDPKMKMSTCPEPMKPSDLVYPTSSRHGPKNWDKFGDDESDDESKDVNFFFKNLYSNATPEQQRAMMKSFTESNGTSLSTDWNDVKGRTIETVPPEGVEAKKWE